MEEAGGNVFGTPITEGTRTQRAQAAAKDKNADGKFDKLLQFAHSQEAGRSRGVGFFKSLDVNITTCFLYNATGDPMCYVTAHDWQGHVAGRGPKIIQNGQYAYLEHTGTPDPEGSIGAVVFNIMNITDSMIAWNNPIKTPTFGKNTAYCQMNDPGYFNYCNWNELYHAVMDCRSEYETSMEGFTIALSITPHGNNPRCNADFYLNAG